PQILHYCLGDRGSRYSTMDELHRDLLRLARRLAPRVSHALSASTTIGLEPTRTTNQDAYAYLNGRLESEDGPTAWSVICLADGMGGMAAGEVASSVAVQAVMATAAAALAGDRDGFPPGKGREGKAMGISAQQRGLGTPGDLPCPWGVYLALRVPPRQAPGGRACGRLPLLLAPRGPSHFTHVRPFSGDGAGTTRPIGLGRGAPTP